MKAIYSHILVFALVFAMSLDSLAQERHYDDMSVRLDEYEALCCECLELKAKAAAGERVSRDKAQSLLSDFLAANRALKMSESDMTVVQRQRFAAIGQWFTTGNPPKESEYAVLQMLPVPVETLIGVTVEPLVWTNVGSQTNVDFLNNVRTSIYVLADMSVPDYSYGLMAGYQYKRIGGYLRFRSNFHKWPSVEYECYSDGTMSVGGGKFWASGATDCTTMSMTAGVLVQAMRHLTIYAGAGYGYQVHAWEDIGGSWAYVSDLFWKGAASDVGAIFSWRRFAVSAGVSTISFKTAAFTCGIGVRL